METNYIHNSWRAIVCGKLPFKPDKKQVIYVEKEYDEQFNAYLLENEDVVRGYFEELGYNFIYLPTLTKRLQEDSRIISSKAFSYALGKGGIPPLCSDMLNDCILDFSEKDFGPGFICINSEKNYVHGAPIYDAFYYRLQLTEPSSIKAQLQDYWHIDFPPIYPDRRDIRCHHSLYFPGPGDHSALLMDEIRYRVKQLRLIGIEETVIQSLFKREEKLSRLLITKNYRILLPDYDNMEIKMAGLPKALYLLYLNHPEGICFKELSDYREELTRIYKKVTNRSDRSSIEKSIADLIDPTNNSINEKCARIRKAFLDCLCDRDVLFHYCIIGQRSEAKRILLPRELVMYECEAIT